jgi:D-sedoheptulose 7-phosphate isomerase
MSYSIETHLNQSAETYNKMIELAVPLTEIAQLAITRLRDGRAIYWIGNGGSASDAEHLAAELSGRFALEREPINSIALTCNSSSVTAIANDYGFGQVFSRQIKAHVKKMDIVIGISTSGKSINVLNGLQTAKTLGATTVLFTGRNFENVDGIDYVINAPSTITAHIQEVHIAIGQALCGYIESEWAK